MRIVVAGPGAIGCLFAGLLVEAGREDVWLLDKNDSRAQSISKKGTRIDHPNGSRVVPVKITAHPADIACAELLVICVKSFDVTSAIKHALSLVDRKTIVVTLANGAGNVEQIAEFVPKDQIVGGITSHGSTRLGEGHVRHAGSGATTFAAFLPGQRELAEKAASVFSDSGIQTDVISDIQGLIWSKLIVSAAINPLTAILGVQNGRLLEMAEQREIMCRAATEAASVARAKCAVLQYDDVIKEVEMVCRNTTDNVSSMLQDVRGGRRTEIDAITGVVVREAGLRGIPVPTNEMLLEKMRIIEKQRRGKYEA